MTDSFDPYHKWLGIPAKEQPPNRYRLLGLALFEADPDVIESAADQRMSHVRTFQAGAHSALSQKLLNELAEAKLCLLKPDQRQKYDELLRGQLSAAATPPASGQAAPIQAAPIQQVPVPAAPVPLSGGPPISTIRSVRTKRKKSSGARAGLAALGIMAALVGGGIAYWESQGGPEPIANAPPKTSHREADLADLVDRPTKTDEPRKPLDAAPVAEPVAGAADADLANQEALNRNASPRSSASQNALPRDSAKQFKPRRGAAGVTANPPDFAWGAAKEPEIESPTKAAARVRVDDVAPDTISTGPSSSVFERKPAPPPRPRMAPKDAISHQGSWYWFSGEQVTVQEAAAAAKRLKGRLVTITSDDENQFITEHLRGPTFLGLLKVKKIWLDPSGRPQDYFRWDRGQPSSSGGERFAAILRNGRWHDYVEDRLFLCIEWGKEP